MLVLVPNSEVRGIEASPCEARCFLRKFGGSSRERADDGEDGPPNSLGDCSDELAGGVLSGDSVGDVGDDTGDCGGAPSAASNLDLLGSRSRSLSRFGLAEDPLA